MLSHICFRGAIWGGGEPRGRPTGICQSLHRLMTSPKAFALFALQGPRRLVPPGHLLTHPLPSRWISSNPSISISRQAEPGSTKPEHGTAPLDCRRAYYVLYQVRHMHSLILAESYIALHAALLGIWQACRCQPVWLEALLSFSQQTSHPIRPLCWILHISPFARRPSSVSRIFNVGTE